MEKPYANNGELPEGRTLSREVFPVESSGKTEKRAPFSRMSPAQHLDEARRALEDGYKLDVDPVKTVWGRIDDARRHLGAIEPESSQYIAARGLMHKALLRKKHVEKVCVNVANQLMVKQREMLAAELEQYYVNRGIFVDIELSGMDKTCMKLGCSFFCEVSVDRIADETNFFALLRKAGFKRVVLGDNDENVWTYSFERSPLQTTE